MAQPVVIVLSKSRVNARSVQDLNEYMDWNPMHKTFMNSEPGREHYKMLAEISHQLPNNAHISDVGTYYGTSALALSSNPNVNVMSYDIGEFIPKGVKSPLNRANIQMNVMSGHADIATISKSAFVLLDIDPHDGPEETRFVNFLIEHGFRGVLACDDIYLNSGMKDFWDNIPQQLKKIDVSDMAHWTGTGVVVFDPSHIDVVIA
jgi:predicted O-methyltransferase YrrM